MRRLSRLARRAGNAVVGAALVSALAGCGGTPTSTSEPASTTPLGSPADLPNTPLAASPAQLECTQQALIARVCDLDLAQLEEAPPYTRSDLRAVDYYGPKPQVAHFLYFTQNSTIVRPIAELSCYIPGGDARTKAGNVELSATDWSTITAPGSILPAPLQPDTLAVRRTTPSTSDYLPAAPTLPAASPASPDPALSDCDTRAVEVFTRLANGQITLTQARQLLPAAVPASALTNGLAGVRRYQQDGIGRANAINEAAGAVAQSCPR